MESNVIIKKINDKEVKGVLTIKEGKYYYDYPFNRELSKKLRKGDVAKIAHKLGYTWVYTRQVLSGVRFNELVLIEAECIGRLNVENGYVTV